MRTSCAAVVAATCVACEPTVVIAWLPDAATRADGMVQVRDADDGEAPSALRAIGGVSTRDVWAVGEAGVAMRWDGAQWRRVTTGTTASLLGVWASAPDDVWAVGSESERNVVLRWNGERWARVSTPASERAPHDAVWGSRAGDVWIVGGSAASPSSNALHWTGTSWTLVSVDTRPRVLTAVSGRAADDVWALGTGAFVTRWNGSAWTEVSAEGRPENFTGGLAVVGPNDVWTTGPSGLSHYTGSRWTSVSVGVSTPLRGVWAARGDDVWAVGARGLVVHWNGVAWTNTRVTTADLWAVWGSGTGDVWAVGDGPLPVRLSP